MKILSTLFVACIIISGTAMAMNYKSEYAGEETRLIKSLSPDDISDLQNGKGWGLAKAAELNGLPGPAHILEMEGEISLSAKQKNDILNLYNEMKVDAIRLGKKLVLLESDLDTQFANKTITNTSLVKAINGIEKVRAELRIVHLATHLQTPTILTREQVALYNELRGYSNNPCENIPEGHSEEMWKKHNGCN